MPRRHMTHERSTRIPVWANWSVAPTAIGGTTSSLLLVANAALLALRPFTIIRTRGRIFINSDQSAATELSRGVLGSIIVEEEAADAGVASLPTPGTETEAPWFLYEPWFNQFVFGDGTGFIEPAGTMIAFDSKAMRKVGISEDVTMVAENLSGAGVVLGVVGRMLIKLH